MAFSIEEEKPAIFCHLGSEMAFSIEEEKPAIFCHLGSEMAFSIEEEKPAIFCHLGSEILAVKSIYRGKHPGNPGSLAFQ